MSKEKYITPITSVVSVEQQTLLAVSNPTGRYEKGPHGEGWVPTNTRTGDIGDGHGAGNGHSGNRAKGGPWDDYSWDSWD